MLNQNRINEINLLEEENNNFSRNLRISPSRRQNIIEEEKSARRENLIEINPEIIRIDDAFNIRHNSLNNSIQNRNSENSFSYSGKI